MLTFPNAPQTQRLAMALDHHLALWRKVSQKVLRNGMTLSNRFHLWADDISEKLDTLSAHERLTLGLSSQLHRRSREDLESCLKTHPAGLEQELRLTLFTNKTHPIPKGEIVIGSQKLSWTAGRNRDAIDDCLRRLSQLERLEEMFAGEDTQPYVFRTGCSTHESSRYIYPSGSCAEHAALRHLIVSKKPILPLGARHNLKGSTGLPYHNDNPIGENGWKDRLLTLAQTLNVPIFATRAEFEQAREHTA